MQWEWLDKLKAWFLCRLDKLIGYSPNDDQYDEVKVQWTERDEEVVKRLERLRKYGLF